MIRTPEHWPMAWWSADATLVRLACPGCGEFQLFYDRSNCTPKLECRSCGLAGAKPVQAAMDAWQSAHATAREQDAAAHRHAAAEGKTGEALRRQHSTRTMR
jgi:hypothetical protein